MQFRTKVPILSSNFKIDYNAKIVSMGSCFAENISEKLDYFKFENTCNPLGIIFNPVSIEKIIYRTLNQIFYSEKDIFFHNERWNCDEVHSDFSSFDKEELMENLNAVLKTSLIQLFQASHIIITYGTSWVYRNLESKAIVANCHKVPQAAFSKEILSIETIQKAIRNTTNLIQEINPDVNFIFTVSPVRHLKDGFVENQLSKSHLISALHSTNSQLPTSSYFPSYEIMMDELRDYRFYGEDMIHPNSVAIDYIWQRFSETTVSAESHPIMKEVETIQRGLAHRAFNSNSESHQQFLSTLSDKIVSLQNRFPQIQF